MGMGNLRSIDCAIVLVFFVWINACARNRLVTVSPAGDHSWWFECYGTWPQVFLSCISISWIWLRESWEYEGCCRFELGEGSIQKGERNQCAFGGNRSGLSALLGGNVICLCQRELIILDNLSLAGWLPTVSISDWAKAVLPMKLTKSVRAMRACEFWFGNRISILKQLFGVTYLLVVGYPCEARFSRDHCVDAYSQNKPWGGCKNDRILSRWALSRMLPGNILSWQGSLPNAPRWDLGDVENPTIFAGRSRWGPS